jgi:PAP2 superfamily protein
MTQGAAARLRTLRKKLRIAKPVDTNAAGAAEGESAPVRDEAGPGAHSRRAFLGQLAGTAAAVAASELASGRKAEAAPGGEFQPTGTYAPLSQETLINRRLDAYDARVARAKHWRDVNFSVQLANDDELIYPEKFANCSRMLPHDGLGHPDLESWDALVKACNSGDPADFNAIRLALGGGRPLRNPQGGFAFDLCGYDSHQTIIPPAPAFASARRAAEAVELYWAALLRDVPFADWATDPLVAQACADLSELSDYGGPKEAGVVTPNTIFRGPYLGCLNGPFVSQFLLKDVQFGSQPIVQRQRTFMPGIDYLTAYDKWLEIQNCGPFPPRVYDPVNRYIRSLRDGATWVDADPPAQAGEWAMLILLNSNTNAKIDAANPYFNGQIINQDAFTTFGPVEWFDMVGRAPRAAHVAGWFQKWRIHRTLRPEEFGGRVHNHKIGAFSYPLHADVLESDAVAETFKRQGSYLCSTAYPEGAPTHCSYPSGHSVGAGSTVTMLKALFGESFIQAPVMPSADGLSLVPYEGPPLSVRGELNKLAWNIGWFRCAGGIHWRSDVVEGNKLGEQVSIGIMRDMKAGYNEPYAGYKLIKLDGTSIQI